MQGDTSLWRLKKKRRRRHHQGSEAASKWRWKRAEGEEGGYIKAAKKKLKGNEESGSDWEGEKKNGVKWQIFEIETLIAIRREMDEEFAKCGKKQGM